MARESVSSARVSGWAASPGIVRKRMGIGGARKERAKRSEA